MKTLRIVILKPAKYGISGHVERFKRGFMPNATNQYILSMVASIPSQELWGWRLQPIVVDEYVETNLSYLSLINNDVPTLLLLAGVQSHQFHRALDLAAYAHEQGVPAVIGGPHPMTCDTSLFHESGISFSRAEAEMVLQEIIADAISGNLKPLYGENRWQAELKAPVLIPPARQQMRKYVAPMLGIYPARGCPFTCNFCSVIKIAGRKIRSQSIEVTIESFRRAKAAGVRYVLLTSDNLNKWPDAKEFLQALIEDGSSIPFMCQCDTQVGKQEELIELLGRAGCFQMFLGAESFNRKTLLAAHKAQNHPETYGKIVKTVHKNGFFTHFSNILGFPGQSVADIHDHVRTLQELNPDDVSFYALTPIPGTDQYADFMNRGLIIEKNLDRFDTTCSTWKHDLLDSRQMIQLVYDCYIRFHSVRKIVRGLLARHPKMDFWSEVRSRIFPLFKVKSAFEGIHPMSGGIGNVLLDHVNDYLPLRRKRYGVTLAPLPKNLELSSADALLNGRVNVTV